ncbi:MAG TPA: murein biosynthesis integral membrane protein MurJ [Gaiella sp.]|nr:murein biosynthesis integral membrane protein MurJ [Gaiella sp.]
MTEVDQPLDPTQAEERAHRRRLARSTAVFGAATALSRVLGLVREMIAAPTFGAAGKINAFTVAFQIPNLVRALVADTALSGAFVPVFSELLERGERLRAWRVASTIFWLMLLLTTGLTAVFVLIAPLIVELFGTPGGSFDLAVGLSRLLFPIVILLALSGIIVGILNSYDQFTVPALTPVAWNLVIILGLVLGVPAAGSEDAELYVYAGSIVLATLVQLLLPVPWLRGLDGRLRVAIDWRDPAVRRFFVLMLPVTLTLGLINVSTLIGTLFASRLIDPDLAPRAIDLAFRLYMLPQGIFSVAVATVLFPTMARLAARGDMPGFGRTVDTGVRQIGFLLIPAGLVSAILAEPIIRLLYQRGEFTPDQTPVVAGALAAFTVGLVFNGWMLLLNRAFYGLRLNWIPTLVALGNLILNVILFAALYRVGVWGLPLATSLSNLAGAVALAVLMGRRVGGVDTGATMLALGRIVLAAAIASGLAALAWWGLDDVVGRSTLGQVVSVGAGLGIGTVAYVVACRALGVRELGSLLELRRSA